ncbi:uncharacterized protein EAF01_010647 [Botrytis porri]|uniref:uncharacterized protein n=1 Tax=Botrytis porri TaxID=87229 RepID=UPI001900363C|nr:uncharacterized protein EAF01_010647 [Botrytis porri]KAF7890838.1 hypothetical protein EAF01_010647 [Botrytis porri]
MKAAAKVDLCSLLGSIGYLAGTREQCSLPYTFSRWEDNGHWAMDNVQWAMSNEQSKSPLLVI